MNNINFCAICPIPDLELVKGRPWHLVLAHLVEESDVYTDFYRNESLNGCKIILDNSAFECFKRGEPMYDPHKLIEMGHRVKADYIVLSDYPDNEGYMTIQAAEKLIPIFKEAGFKTFFVPQSKVGDIDDYLNTWEWAAENPDIDMIGLSILGAPNAYGVEKNNNLQRYLSRFTIIKELYKRGVLSKLKQNSIHMLGLVDGYKEIEFFKPYKYYINSIDSSQPIWHGHLGIKYDDTPTGLLHGKNETEVDFYTNLKNIDIGLYNLNQIDKLIES